MCLICDFVVGEAHAAIPQTGTQVSTLWSAWMKPFMLCHCESHPVCAAAWSPKQESLLFFLSQHALCFSLNDNYIDVKVFAQSLFLPQLKPRRLTAFHYWDVLHTCSSVQTATCCSECQGALAVYDRISSLIISPLCAIPPSLRHDLILVLGLDSAGAIALRAACPALPRWALKSNREPFGAWKNRVDV